MTDRGVIGDVIETRGNVFEWRIPDFLSLTGDVGDGYESPDFDACHGKWCLQILPHGASLDLFLYRLVDASPPEALNVTLGIRDSEGMESEKRSREISEDEDVCSWSGFCSRSDLVERKSRLLPGDALNLTLDMKSDAPGVAKGGEKALEDFGKLLDSGEQSDITVQIDDVDFKLHGAILFARSPTLSAHLQQERRSSKERASKKVNIIEGCRPDVFREYLRYLYTESVQSLTEQNVFGLYRLADKYLADDLKQQCLVYIRDTLSVQTFCDVVQLALTHGESGLLGQATDFAKENIRSIIRSEEWQNFNRDHPMEANGILVKALGPPS